MIANRDFILFWGSLAVAACLIVGGILIYPDNHAAKGAAADVQLVRYIDRNR